MVSCFSLNKEITMKKAMKYALIIGIVWFAYHAFAGVHSGVQTVKAAAQTEQQSLDHAGE